MLLLDADAPRRNWSITRTSSAASTPNTSASLKMVARLGFGGISTYRNRRDLLRRVEEFMRKKEVLDAGQSLPALDPAYVPELIELVLRFCSKPAAAGRVPQYLNFRSGEVAAQLTGETSVRTSHGESNLTEKLAFDLLEFVGKAARIDPTVIRTVQTFDGPLSVPEQQIQQSPQPGADQLLK